MENCFFFKRKQQGVLTGYKKNNNKYKVHCKLRYLVFRTKPKLQFNFTLAVLKQKQKKTTPLKSLCLELTWCEKEKKNKNKQTTSWLLPQPSQITSSCNSQPVPEAQLD